MASPAADPVSSMEMQTVQIGYLFSKDVTLNAFTLSGELCVNCGEILSLGTAITLQVLLEAANSLDLMFIEAPLEMEQHLSQKGYTIHPGFIDSLWLSIPHLRLLCCSLLGKEQEDSFITRIAKGKFSFFSQSKPSSSDKQYSGDAGTAAWLSQTPKQIICHHIHINPFNTTTSSTHSSGGCSEAEKSGHSCECFTDPAIKPCQGISDSIGTDESHTLPQCAVQTVSVQTNLEEDMCIDYTGQGHCVGGVNVGGQGQGIGLQVQNVGDQGRDVGGKDQNVRGHDEPARENSNRPMEETISRENLHCSASLATQTGGCHVRESNEQNMKHRPPDSDERQNVGLSDGTDNISQILPSQENQLFMDALPSPSEVTGGQVEHELTSKPATPNPPPVLSFSHQDIDFLDMELEDCQPLQLHRDIEEIHIEYIQQLSTASREKGYFSETMATDLLNGCGNKQHTPYQQTTKIPDLLDDYDNSDDTTTVSVHLSPVCSTRQAARASEWKIEKSGHTTHSSHCGPLRSQLFRDIRKDVRDAGDNVRSIRGDVRDNSVTDSKESVCENQDSVMDISPFIPILPSTQDNVMDVRGGNRDITDNIRDSSENVSQSKDCVRDPREAVQCVYEALSPFSAESDAFSPNHQYPNESLSAIFTEMNACSSYYMCSSGLPSPPSTEPNGFQVCTESSASPYCSHKVRVSTSTEGVHGPSLPSRMDCSDATILRTPIFYPYSTTGPSTHSPLDAREHAAVNPCSLGEQCSLDPCKFGATSEINPFSSRVASTQLSGGQSKAEWVRHFPDNVALADINVDPMIMNNQELVNLLVGEKLDADIDMLPAYPGHHPAVASELNPKSLVESQGQSSAALGAEFEDKDPVQDIFGAQMSQPSFQKTDSVDNLFEQMSENSQSILDPIRPSTLSSLFPADLNSGGSSFSEYSLYPANFLRQQPVYSPTLPQLDSDPEKAEDSLQTTGFDTSSDRNFLPSDLELVRPLPVAPCLSSFAGHELLSSNRDDPSPDRPLTPEGKDHLSAMEARQVGITPQSASEMVNPSLQSASETMNPSRPRAPSTRLIENHPSAKETRHVGITLQSASETVNPSLHATSETVTPPSPRAPTDTHSREAHLRTMDTKLIDVTSQSASETVSSSLQSGSETVSPSQQSASVTMAPQSPRAPTTDSSEDHPRAVETVHVGITLQSAPETANPSLQSTSEIMSPSSPGAPTTHSSEDHPRAIETRHVSVTMQSTSEMVNTPLQSVSEAVSQSVKSASETVSPYSPRVPSTHSSGGHSGAGKVSSMSRQELSQVCRVMRTVREILRKRCHLPSASQYVPLPDTGKNGENQKLHPTVHTTYELLINNMQGIGMKRMNGKVLFRLFPKSGFHQIMREAGLSVSDPEYLHLLRLVGCLLRQTCLSTQ